MTSRIKLIVALIPIALMWWWLCAYAMLWRPDGWFSVDMAEGGGQRARRVGAVIAFGCYAALAIPALYSCICGFWHPSQGENFLARSETYGCGSYLVTFVAMLTLMRARNVESQSESSASADSA